MASIQLGKSESWVVANWVYRYLIEESLSRWDKDDAAKQILAGSLVSRLYSFDLAELGETGKARFRQCVAAVYDQLNKADVAEFGIRDGYEGLKARIGDLARRIGAIE